MTPDVTAVAPIPMPTTESEPAATLQTIEERTRAIVEVAEGLRPLIALAQQAPAFIAVVMDSFDEAMRTAYGKGIDVERLIALKNSGKNVRDYADAQRLDTDAIIDIECEIWIPAARPDVVRKDNVARLKTKLVAQGANIPFTPGREKNSPRPGHAYSARLHRQRRRRYLRIRRIPRRHASAGA